MNKNQEISTKNIRAVGLRYFSEEDNGIELSKNLGYAFLVKVGEDFYINPFNPLEGYPLFERVPYSNVTIYGEEFGSKVSLVCGEEKTGPCYITLADDATQIFKKDTVTVGEVEDLILRSPYYFMDRHDIALSRYRQHPLKMQKILNFDEAPHAEMVDFFEKRSVQIQKVNSKK